MKRLTTLFACLFTLSFFGIGQTCAAPPAAQVQFFEYIATDDVTQLMSVMDEELKAEIDAPVLDAWLHAFNERLGHVNEMKLTGWTRNDTANGLIVETHCDVACQRGNADSTLTVRNGKVIGFHVKSEQMANFFEGPTSTGIYEELGENFINKLLEGDVATAHELCHPAPAEGVVSRSTQRDGAFSHRSSGNP